MIAVGFRARRFASLFAGLVLAWIPASPSLGQPERGDAADREALDAIQLVPHSVLDSKAVKIALRQADAWARDGRYTDACAALQDIIDRYPNHLVAVGGGLYQGAHEHALDRLRALPREALDVYRTRYDADAGAALDEALRERDPARIRDVWLRFAASSLGDDALEALASLHLERGDPAEALFDLSELSHRYPDSPFDSALRLAKVAFCHAALGDAAAVEKDLDLAKRRFPDARVRIAGRDVKLADYIAERARASTHAPRTAPPVAWERLGGDNANSRPFAPVSQGLENQWHTSLDFDASKDASLDMGMHELVPDEATVPFHPSVYNGSLILHNGLRVEALNLYNGKRRWTFSGPKSEPTGDPDPRQSFSATVSNGIAYANLEVPVDTRPRQYRFTPIVVPIPERKLFALDVETGTVLWRHDRFDASSNEEEAFIRKASIPTAPLVWRDLVVAGASYFEGKVHSYLCAFDRMTGRLRWKTLICTGQQELNMFGQPWREHVTSPLAESDGTIYFSTNLGYVAAVDVRAGLIRWIAEYSQIPLPISRNYQPLARELTWLNNPPILASDTLYVTPLDSHDLLALDPSGGSVRWRSIRPAGTRQARTLLGLTPSSLVLAGQGLFFWNPQTGQERFPGSPFTHPREAALGRGGIAPGMIICPAEQGLYFLDPDTGRSAAEPRRWSLPGEGGNVISVDGFLVVVSSKEATVYYRWEEIFKRLTQDIAQRPGDPEPVLRLADAFEQGGRLEESSRTYRRAEEMAALLPSSEAAQVAADARHGLYQVHETLGRQASSRGDWQRALDAWEEAARFAYDDETRIRSLLSFERYYRSKGDEVELTRTLRSMIEQVGEASFDFDGDHNPIPAGLYACLRLGEHYQQERRPAEAVGAFQEIIRRYAHARFRGIEAGRFARDQIGLLIDAAGPTAYAAFESEALALFTQARDRKDELSLKRVLEQYPNASITEECLLDLAHLLKASGRRGEAIQALRSFLQAFPRSRLRPEVMADVATAYESEGFVESAAAVLRYLLAQHPSEFISVEGHRTGVDAYARERLKSLPPETRDSGPVSFFTAPGELTEIWKRSYPGAPNIAIAQVEGAAGPFFTDHFLFISNNRVLTCVRRGDGEPVWSLTSLGDIPQERLVFQDGLLVVTTVREAVAVRADTGEEVWRVSTDAIIKSVERGPATFVLSLDLPGGAGTANSYCLRALDLMTGGGVWERTLPGRLFGEPGSIGHLIWAATNPNRVNVSLVDAFTGQTHWDIDPQRGSTVPSFTAEAIAMGSTGLVLLSNLNQVNTLRLFDVARHEQVWEASLKGYTARRLQRVGGDLALLLVPLGRQSPNRQPMHVAQVRSGVTGEVVFERELPGEGMVSMVDVPDGNPDERPDTIFFTRNEPNGRTLIAVDSATGDVRWERTLGQGQPFLKRVHAARPLVACELIIQTEVEPKLVVILLDGKTGEPVQSEMTFDLSGSFRSDVAIVGGSLCIATGNRLYCYAR